MDYCRPLEITETNQWILLKEMVAYDEPCVVPIKRTLQKIDYQNQTYKELEVRPVFFFFFSLFGMIKACLSSYTFFISQVRTLPCCYLVRTLAFEGVKTTGVFLKSVCLVGET